MQVPALLTAEGRLPDLWKRKGVSLEQHPECMHALRHQKFFPHSSDSTNSRARAKHRAHNSVTELEA